MEIDENKIQNLYKKNDIARKVFDYFAKRTYDSTETKVERILTIMKKEGHDLSRGQIVEFFKVLGDLQCGDFISGRRGWPSRFIWKVSPVSLGKNAGGEPQELVSTSVEYSEDEITEMLEHQYHLRPDLKIKIELPSDFSSLEASRLAEYIKSLPFGED